MEIKKLIDKLVFYESFIHSFVERGYGILRDNDSTQLLMAREYMIETRELIQKEVL